ncbi:TetR family transcriptional regulator [Bacillus sp. V-88]|uniref:TetR family transcriptional regulator n=1 Tax=Rossellomorea vietnamensis TaxID=218284 RepID=A0A6I6UT74_9BACI|nr:TetR/AcrR family transcriptional regulator [Rossellomorea vietnamensis]PRX77431.1 TetR family transcriptional regulator [Bacillus sp. V-88]QHE61820.1 TetR family transcriptional regulator [Rossellomorea vietnamensis]SLK20191.1 transcriptional regulator, TetR family [Bacillus sp. V-88]
MNDNKQLIKSVALDLFGQKGYEDTSLAEIAKEVGIKKPSIYNHFRSKEDLFIDVLEDLIVSEVTAYRKTEVAMNHQEPLKNVRVLFDLFCQRLLTTKEALLWKRVTFFPPEQFKDLIQEQFIHLEKVTTSILVSVYKEGVNQGMFQEVTEDDFVASFLCLVDGVFLEHHYYTDEIFQQRIESAWKVYALGISSGKGE